MSKGVTVETSPGITAIGEVSVGTTCVEKLAYIRSAPLNLSTFEIISN